MGIAPGLFQREVVFLACLAAGVSPKTVDGLGLFDLAGRDKRKECDNGGKNTGNTQKAERFKTDGEGETGLGCQHRRQQRQHQIGQAHAQRREQQRNRSVGQGNACDDLSAGIAQGLQDAHIDDFRFDGVLNSEIAQEHADRKDNHRKCRQDQDQQIADHVAGAFYAFAIEAGKHHGAAGFQGFACGLPHFFQVGSTLKRQGVLDHSLVGEGIGKRPEAFFGEVGTDQAGAVVAVLHFLDDACHGKDMGLAVHYINDLIIQGKTALGNIEGDVNGIGNSLVSFFDDGEAVVCSFAVQIVEHRIHGEVGVQEFLDGGLYQKTPVALSLSNTLDFVQGLLQFI